MQNNFFRQKLKQRESIKNNVGSSDNKFLTNKLRVNFIKMDILKHIVIDNVNKFVCFKQ